MSLWFPRLAAERCVRLEPGLPDAVLAVVAERGNARVLASLTAQAEAEGLRPGQPLRDALAMCPTLVTRSADPAGEAAFLAALRRRAGALSPWVAEEAPEALVVDLTGCAHLFGGEVALAAQVEADCAGLGLTVRLGIADTLGAAWALARYASAGGGGALRSGDAIDMEARATRSRAAKRRHWTKGGAAPAARPERADVAGRIAPPGQVYSALAGLPLAALRLSEDSRAGLARLGLRRIGEMSGMPRAALARRFGSDVLMRLDQALGRLPEPVSPSAPAVGFAMRLTLPEPIGLSRDILAGIDRLLPPLCAKLAAQGKGARRLRLELMRVDQAREVVEVGLARPGHDAARMRPLLAMKLDAVDAGFGIDVMRLEAVGVEPVHPTPHRGPDMPTSVGQAQQDSVEMEDLIGRLGARVGLEAITRRHPADSHIPEKSAQILAAAWSEPSAHWPMPARPRPLTLFVRPEPVMGPDAPDPPMAFRWRGQTHAVCCAVGPERLSPEWWLDDPNWRSGVRDYWRVTTEQGRRLWLYFAHGGTMSAGWFCHGVFE